ncbi:MAG: DUF493 domain-containing protein [Anaerolineaceae bacterium]|nr:DUF493 domain-containing protein [Anaerolineaceae bacterium]
MDHLTLDENGKLKFPCVYPLKVFGKDEDDFEHYVLTLLREFLSEEIEISMSSKLSSKGSYLAVTATFVASSREQIDAIYTSFSSNKRILMLI